MEGGIERGEEGREVESGEGIRERVRGKRVLIRLYGYRYACTYMYMYLSNLPKTSARMVRSSITLISVPRSSNRANLLFSALTFSPRVSVCTTCTCHVHIM